MKPLVIEKENHITWVKLNRPEVHNAFNQDLMEELFEIFRFIDHDTDTRLAILTGEGKSFSAGADLNYMKSAAQKTKEQNIEDSLFMAKMLNSIKTCSKPIIGLINGTALGGGMGLMSVCDVVLASETAKFGFSEVKLGMAPSVISPFVIEKIGIKNAKKLFLTGERFGADTAVHIGLADHIYNESTKDTLLNKYIKTFQSNSPNAMAQVKSLIQGNLTLTGNELARFTAEQISDLRSSPEAQEGMRAFFEKRKPDFDLS